MTNFVYMVHTVTAGWALFPDEPGVIEAQEARGWQRHAMPPELDVDAPNASPGQVSLTEPILTDEQVDDLRGAALDEALETAGVPKSGTVAEKRARLSEHEAALADPTPQEEGSE